MFLPSMQSGAKRVACNSYDLTYVRHTRIQNIRTDSKTSTIAYFFFRIKYDNAPKIKIFHSLSPKFHILCNRKTYNFYYLLLYYYLCSFFCFFFIWVLLVISLFSFFFMIFFFFKYSKQNEMKNLLFRSLYISK